MQWSLWQVIKDELSSSWLKKMVGNRIIHGEVPHQKPEANFSAQYPTEMMIELIVELLKSGIKPPAESAANTTHMFSNS